MLQRHREADATPIEPDLAAKDAKRIERLQRDAAQIRDWLAAASRRPARGEGRDSEEQSHRQRECEDGDRQGRDPRLHRRGGGRRQHQIIVEAQAHGTRLGAGAAPAGGDGDARPLPRTTVITADAGYHSEANLKQLAAMQGRCAHRRQRDAAARRALRRRRTATRPQPDPLYDKIPAEQRRARSISRATSPTTPRRGRACVRRGSRSIATAPLPDQRLRVDASSAARKRDCVPCPLRAHVYAPREDRGAPGGVLPRASAATGPSRTPAHEAAHRFPRGRARYGQRFGTVEPVFGNLRYNKGLDRFTLRGQTKVDGQWKLFCLVHNIEKLAHHGYAQ